MENRRNRQYLNLPALQERPVTLGELLYRDGLIERPDPPPAPRTMGRTMSPTRCLGPLANGRPRRARGRTITRPSTSSATNDEDTQGESQQPQQNQEQQDSRQSQRRRRPQSSRVLSDLMRNATAEARIRNFFCLMNGQRRTRRRGTTTANRPGHHGLAGGSDSPEPLSSSILWQRRSSTGVHRTRRRTSITSGSRIGTAVPRRSQRSRMRRVTASPMEDRPRGARITTCRYRGAGYSRAVYSWTSTSNETATTDSGENNGINSRSDIPAPVRRFIDFAAEFIPVEEHPPDAEPPEWSLNITAADFGPFAVGRSALSRARSLAIMGVLSQVDDNGTGAAGNERPNPNEN